MKFEQLGYNYHVLLYNKTFLFLLWLLHLHSYQMKNVYYIGEHVLLPTQATIFVLLYFLKQQQLEV